MDKRRGEQEDDDDSRKASTYGLVIRWLCKKGMMARAHEVFEEMRERGVRVNDSTLGDVVYGLLTRRRVREAYRVFEGIEVPDSVGDSIPLSSNC